MKTPYNAIYAALKINRLIVWLVVVCATLSSLFSGWMVYRMHQQSLQNAFAISDQGEVIPLKLVSQYENLEVEALAHLEQFHRFFYDIDASNYESNLEKALWLGNNSVDNIYRQKKNGGRLQPPDSVLAGTKCIAYRISNRFKYRSLSLSNHGIF